MSKKFPTRELGSAKLSLALWITSHKLLFRSILVWGLIAASVFFYGFSIFGLIKIYILDKARDENAMRQLTFNSIEYGRLNTLLGPKDLAFSSIFILPSSGAKRDFAVKVINQNENFFVRSLVYQYTLGDEVIYEGETYVYPGEEKYLVAFGQEVSGSDTAVNMVIKNIFWKRTDKAFYELVSLARNFSLRNIELTNPSGSQTYQSSFTLVNESVFSYWNVDVFLYQLNGDRLSAVNFTTVDKIAPKQSKDVIVTWLGATFPQSRVEIVADINILDENNYMEQEQGPGEQK